MEQLKKHPWLIVGGVSLLVLLLFLRGSGGTADPGVASQQVADAANVQLAGLSTQLQINQSQINAAQSIQQNTNETQLAGIALSYLDHINNNFANLEGQRQQITGDLQLNAANASLLPQLATIEGATQSNLATINADQNIQLANIETGAQVTIANQRNDLAFNQALLGTGTTLLTGSPTGASGVIGAFGGGSGIGSAAGGLGGLAALFA